MIVIWVKKEKWMKCKFCLHTHTFTVDITCFCHWKELKIHMIKLHMIPIGIRVIFKMCWTTFKKNLLHIIKPHSRWICFLCFLIQTSWHTTCSQNGTQIKWVTQRSSNIREIRRKALTQRLGFTHTVEKIQAGLMMVPPRLSQRQWFHPTAQDSRGTVTPQHNPDSSGIS